MLGTLDEMVFFEKIVLDTNLKLMGKFWVGANFAHRCFLKKFYFSFPPLLIRLYYLVV
jgi:hypothetical protein